MLKTLNSVGCLFIFMMAVSQEVPDLSPVLSGGYVPGIMGVRDYVNPGVDGLFFLDYNIFLNSDSYFDQEGNKVNAIGNIPFNVNISGYINSLMLVYASPKLDFLGEAQYLFIISPNYATAGLGVGLGQITSGNTINGGASGFGDLTVSPIMLSWSQEKFDLTAGYLFIAPTGRYESGSDDNVGLGYWSHSVQAAFYFYPKPEKTTAILILPTYEWHSLIKDAEVRPGSRLILEYGISQYLSDRIEITIQGGHAWQIGKDSGADVYWDTTIKDQMSLVSAGLGYWIKPNVFYLQAKYGTTYNNNQHFRANIFQIELLITTNLLKKKN
ncbi:SphA family protein [Eudoraea chungangensis]|uniref:SphA family protein n=1 Tax=Eudoraea chungangensis TaxID=1481905 RepID=UPI0023EBC2BA|nr:transporter [Eudoraea chungangensis]